MVKHHILLSCREQAKFNTNKFFVVIKNGLLFRLFSVYKLSLTLYNVPSLGSIAGRLWKSHFQWTMEFKFIAFPWPDLFCIQLQSHQLRSAKLGASSWAEFERESLSLSLPEFLKEKSSGVVTYESYQYEPYDSPRKRAL